MSNKDWELLSKIDQRIRRAFPTEVWGNGEIICTIEFYGGFELFNTRPYHNYETWSEGYRIKTGERFGSLVVSSEDLDDAIKLMEKELKLWRDGWKEVLRHPPEIGQRVALRAWDGRIEIKEYEYLDRGKYVHWKEVDDV